MSFSEKLTRMLQKGAAKTEEIAKTGKLKIEIAAINSRINDKKIVLGDKAYVLIKDGKLTDESLKSVAAEIDGLRAQVKEKLAEIDKING
jgi:hypothetical protein